MMDGRVDLVLDGGACAGAGATTVDITEPYWKVIRQARSTKRKSRSAWRIERLGARG